MLFKCQFISSLLILFIINSTQSITNKDWSNYKQKYNLKFRSSIDELTSYNKYITNKDLIDDYNKKSRSSFKLKLNSKAHFTLIEFKAKFLLKSNVTRKIMAKLSHLVKTINPNKEINLKVFQPREWDWFKSGVVTPVRDQLTCGCCYSFATCASVESIVAINTKKLVVLAPQQILDCSQKDYKNQGCDGGYADESFLYVQDRGLEEDATYPYQNKVNPTCKVSAKRKKYKISSYSEIYMDVDSMIIALINHGPLVAYISASSHLFQYYGSGVLNSTKCPSDADNLDHAVTIVGYGTDNKTNQDYWLIKNSWGIDWGENGYVRIARGVNMCGVEINSFHPIF